MDCVDSWFLSRFCSEFDLAFFSLEEICSNVAGARTRRFRDRHERDDDWVFFVMFKRLEFEFDREKSVSC